VYDAILGESDSDLDFSDLEEQLNKVKGGKPKKGHRNQETFIREGSEELVDLLSQSVFSHVSTHRPPTRAEQSRRAAKAASRASTYKSTAQGRMIFEEPAPQGKKEKPGKAEVEYNAYEEVQESRDMAKRGFRDRIKFSNKRSRQDAEGFTGDVEMTNAYSEKTLPPKKKTVRFGGR
jgi:ribosomal RNA-processing protein 12